MASKIDSPLYRIVAALILLLAISASQFAAAGAHSGAHSPDIPSLPDFASAFADSDSGRLRGFYVEDMMANLVVQQPKNAPNFVSSQRNVLTQFSLADEAGNIGLLAHNNLAGRNFESLHLGEMITLVYGGGRVETYVITRIYRYQALTPTSGHSRLMDLKTQVIYRAEDVFDMMYAGEKHVTLQTCIEKDGNENWGRLFLIAEKVEPPQIDSTPFAQQQSQRHNQNVFSK